MNTAIVAVAGAGKTEALADAVVRESRLDKVAVLTYTVSNQIEDSNRIASKSKNNATKPRVFGWFAFLLNEIVKPYLPKLYPGIKLSGLAVNEPESFQYFKGHRKYISGDGFAYPSFLGKLAFDVIKASNGAAIARLECIYDSIYIDEGQDLRGNDLCVLEKLLRSKIEITILLDPRQSTLCTTSRDQKYKKNYACYKIIELFRIWEKKRLLTIRYKNETHRSIQEIAHFSDIILGANIGLGETTSNVPYRGYRDGIMLIDKSSVTKYSYRWNATVLAVQESKKIDAHEAINVGESKGVTRDDVVVVATGPIERFLQTGAALEPKSACSFYVAVTRARYSVALAVSDPAKTLQAMSSADSIWRNIAISIAE